MKLSLDTNGMPTGARAVVELRDPRRALMVDLSSVNEILHLNQVITREYFVLRFVGQVIGQTPVKHGAFTRAIPPVVGRTSSVNAPLTTSRILAPYSRFVAFSCSLYTANSSFYWYIGALG